MEKAFKKFGRIVLNLKRHCWMAAFQKHGFEPIKLACIKRKVLTIQVPSQFFYEYLEEHYVSFCQKH